MKALASRRLPSLMAGEGGERREGGERMERGGREEEIGRRERGGRGKGGGVGREKGEIGRQERGGRGRVLQVTLHGHEVGVATTNVLVPATEDRTCSAFPTSSGLSLCLFNTARITLCECHCVCMCVLCTIAFHNAQTTGQN